MFIVKSLWNVVKKEDRVCIFLPDIRKYFNYINKPIIHHFRQTILLILKENPRLIVIFLPENVKDNEYYMYEEFYNLEIQELEDISVLDNPNFNKYLRSDKLYVVPFNKETTPLKICNNYFDICIIDNLDITTKEEWIKDIETKYEYGKCYIQDVINVKMYLHKSLNRYIRPIISSMINQNENDECDIGLIFGKTIESDITSLKDILYDLCKKNLLTIIFSANKEVTEICRDVLSMNNYNIPIIYLPESMTEKSINKFMERIKKVSFENTSFLFMGSYYFEDDKSLANWKKNREEFINNSIYDISAFTTLLPDEINVEETKYRLTFDPQNLMKLYIEMDI